MESNFNSFLGTGWAFPPEFDLDSRTVKLVSNDADIKESLNILLSTTLGERVMQPRYGCNLKDYLFGPLSSTMIGYIKDLVGTAILYYEPRIIVDTITVTSADSTDLLEGKFLIQVDYTIPNSNSRFNFVYDYYLTEALRPV